MSPEPKRRKCQSSRSQVVDLPHELLEQVVTSLSRQDLCNLSVVCKDFRQKLLPFVFEHVKVSWADIIGLQSKDASFKNINYVRSVRINKADSYNEYRQNNLSFGELVSRDNFPNLDTVAVNSQSLSYWLKYNKCTHITSLTLYCDTWFRGVKIFQLPHVDNFLGLQLLCLHKYHFNWSEEDVFPQTALLKLTLHDCTWEYPFDLAHFNLHDSLRDLTITYSNNNPFTLLERFLSFLRDPFTGHSASFRTVKLLVVNVDEARLNKQWLSTAAFEKLLSSFSGMELLQICGWTVNLNYVRDVLLEHKFEYPFLLVLQVESPDCRDVDAYIERLAGVANLKLKVTLL